MLLEGKSAVVTGSSRGLGRAYTIALAEARAKVVVNSMVAEDVGKVVLEIRAIELARYNITVNAIRAAARTRMTEPLLQSVIQKAREAGEPIPSPEELGFYEPEAAAPLVVFLASEAANWINGQVIAIDGPRLVLWSHPKQSRVAYMFPRWSVETLLRYFKVTIGAELESFGVSEVVPYFEQKAERKT